MKNLFLVILVIFILSGCNKEVQTPDYSGADRQRALSNEAMKELKDF